MSAPQFDLNALYETARRLTPLQQRLLQSLRDKGPGLLLELAVRVLQLLNDPAFQRAPIVADSALSAAQEARRQEAELLRQMGDVAKEAGDLAKALEYYEKALEITRELSAATGGSK